EGVNHFVSPWFSAPPVRVDLQLEARHDEYQRGSSSLGQRAGVRSVEVQYIGSDVAISFQTGPALHLIIGTHLSHRLRNGPLVIRAVFGRDGKPGLIKGQRIGGAGDRSR